MYFNKTLLGIFALSVLTISSCVKVDFDEDGDGTTPVDPNSNIISGTISSNRTYAKGNYILKGYVYVTEGATLTFEAGSIIKSDITEKGALVIERGAKLIADGKVNDPIVFTSGKAAGQRAPGDWGGIVLLGKAPTNRPLDPGPTVEGGVGRKYGGTDPNDNSGILRYVRIEYAGVAAEPGSEINGLTLAGVGSGTIIEYVQVSFGNDDAYEFFGGTVNAKYLVALATADDDFDFDFGYTGKIQFAYSVRKPDFVDAGDAANGIEADNDGSGTNALPNTRPQLSNFTILGPNNAPGTADNHNFSNRWRRGVQFVLRNSILAGHPDAGFSMESDATINAYTNGGSEFKNNLVHANSNIYKSGNTSLLTSAALQAKAESEGNLTFTDAAGIQLENPFYSTSPNPLPKAGSPALTGASFAGMPAFFTTTTFRGAFGINNWMEGWTNFNPQTKTY